MATKKQLDGIRSPKDEIANQVDDKVDKFLRELYLEEKSKKSIDPDKLQSQMKRLKIAQGLHGTSEHAVRSPKDELIAEKSARHKPRRPKR